jgi:hypothetical protein
MSPRAVIRSFAALLTVAATVIPGTARADDDEPKKLCTIKDPRIDESSGLAASRRHPGIVYTFNDSDGPTQIYALGPDCRTRATLTVAGARNRDWEAIALGPNGIYIGDIGDNMDGAWPYVTVYRIPEPSVLRSQTLRATAYRIKYADGPRNAETMMINPRTGRLYIASKAFSDSLYEGPKRLSTSGYNIMHKVGDAPFYATDGSFAPDGRTFVIRGYWGAEIYRAPGKKITDVSIPNQKQGEGITFTADGRSLLLSSEGKDQPLWQVPVPAKALPARTNSGSPANSSGKDGASSGSTSGSKKFPVVSLVLVAGVVLLIAGLFARRRGS